MATTRASTGFLWNHLGRSLEFAFLYLQSVVIARSFGAHLYGSYALLMGAVQFLLIASSLGLETVAFSKLPPEFHRGSTETADALFRSLLSLRLFFVIVVGACFAIAASLFPGALGPAVPLVGLTLLLVWYFSLRSMNSLLSAYHLARKNVRRVAVVTIAARVTEFVAVILLVSGGAGIRILFLLFGVVATLQALALVPPSALSFGSVRKETVRPLAGMGSRYWLSSVMEFALGRQADILLLGAFLVDRMLIGQYDAALSLAQGLNGGLTLGLYGISTTLFAAAPDPSSPGLRRQWEAIANAITFVLVPVLVFAVIHARPLVLGIYVASYAGSIPFFQVAGVAYLITRLLGGGLAADYLSARGRTDVLIFAAAVSGAANIALALVLIPLAGPFGALIATCTAALIIAGIHARAVWKMLSVTLPWKTGILLGVLAAISALSVSGLANGGQALPDLLLLFAGYAVVLAALSYLIKPLSLTNVDVWAEHAARFAAIASLFACVPGRIQIGKGKTTRLYDRQKWGFAWAPASATIADVGCSDQPMTPLLHLKAEAVLAVDPDSAALERLRFRAPRIEVLLASAESLPIKSSTVDTVLMLDVLEHTADPQKSLDEAHRVLRPGGTLILSVPNKGAFQYCDPQNLSALIHHRENWKSSHPHYSLSEIRAMLAGKFEIWKIHYGGSIVFPVTFWLGHVLRDHLGVDRIGWLKRIGDWDNDVSWGRLSYSLIVLAHHV